MYICTYVYTDICIQIYIYMPLHVHKDISHQMLIDCHGLATISRLLRIIGLFCKRAL